jgi:uncharacterized protein (DUF2062 family)
MATVLERIRSRIYNFLLFHIKKGVSAKQLAWAIVLGTMVGLVPLIGVSTVLCAFCAHRFKLNHIVVQSAQFLVFPLQILLMVPFYRLGNSIFGNGIAFFSKEFMVNIFLLPFRQSYEKFLSETLYALLVWLLVCLVAAPAFYLVLFKFIKKTNAFKKGFATNYFHNKN